MSIYLHRNDLPDDLDLGPAVAVDSETMGLKPHRDRLCVIQLSAGDGDAHLVQLDPTTSTAPTLCRLLTDPARLKIFHFARFDMAVLNQRFDIDVAPVYCTKIASKLARTYTDRHGLKDLCRELLGMEISKIEQSSDWGATELSESQKQYAAQDVLYLHELRQRLETILEREGRRELAQACFGFLATRISLDLKGWQDSDIFAH